MFSVSVKVIQQNPVGVTESQAQNKQATLDVARNNEDDGSSTTPKQTFTTAARMHSGLQHGPSESDIHGSHTQEEGVKLFRSMVCYALIPFTNV